VGRQIHLRAHLIRNRHFALVTNAYTSITFTERLATARVSGSVGTVSDAYDKALAESVIGLIKTELIKQRGPLAHHRAGSDRDLGAHRLV
jgi:hypothetical protein